MGPWAQGPRGPGAQGPRTHPQASPNPSSSLLFSSLSSFPLSLLLLSLFFSSLSSLFFYICLSFFLVFLIKRSPNPSPRLPEPIPRIFYMIFINFYDFTDFLRFFEFWGHPGGHPQGGPESILKPPRIHPQGVFYLFFFKIQFLFLFFINFLILTIFY